MTAHQCGDCDEPVFERWPAQERLALLPRNDPIAAPNHLDGDGCPARFFAANGQIAHAQEIGPEHQRDEDEQFALAPPSAAVTSLLGFGFRHECPFVAEVARLPIGTGTLASSATRN